jgi:hypothetical protein
MEIELPFTGEIKTTFGTSKFVPLAERCFWLASQSEATCSGVMAFVSSTTWRKPGRNSPKGFLKGRDTLGFFGREVFISTCIGVCSG